MTGILHDSTDIVAMNKTWEGRRMDERMKVNSTRST